MSLLDPAPKRVEPKLVSPDAIVRSGLCIGCGSCVAQANNGPAAMDWDAYGQKKPIGPASFMGEATEAFSRTCPFSPLARNEDQLALERFAEAPLSDPRIGRYEAAYVGAVAEPDFRAEGSSGGMVSWVAAELLRQGLVDGVAHVAPELPETGNGFFRYRISRDLDQLRGGAKSRYYPVDMAGVIAQIRAVPGRYAVVGIPCFTKAVNLLREEDPVLKERIVFVLGLFCGHMKSARMIESFAWQMGAEWSEVQKVEYRLKNPDRPANWYTAQLTQRDGSARTQDWWHLVDGDWGSGFFMNSACNYCDDVVAETADIAFGDAWVEPYSSDGRGTNVVIVRSPLVHGLVQNAIGEGRLDLQPVDHEFVVQTQAAGFRQRREGLAYRLSWPKLGIRPKKRVAPKRHGIAPRRKLIYIMRFGISAWSHRMAWLAKQTGQPRLYVGWGRAALAVYHGVAYGRGRIGKLVDKLKIKGEGG